MPRRKRLRQICFIPEHTLFGPIERTNQREDTVTLSIDAYGSIPLIDVLGYDQEKAAKALEAAHLL
ncbi:MAG: hypothetical protein ACLFTZ_02595 [Acholeplasmataceae bacterium]